MKRCIWPRQFFDAELRLVDDLHSDAAAWEASYQQIRQTVSLVDPAGQAVPEFLLHIDGNHAWWRWSDTPFQ